MAEKSEMENIANARPLDYLKALPTDAMTDEGERIEAGDTVIQLVEQEGEWVPHFYEADGDKVRPPMPDDGTVYEWDEDFGWIEAPLT